MIEQAEAEIYTTSMLEKCVLCHFNCENANVVKILAKPFKDRYKIILELAKHVIIVVLRQPFNGSYY